MELTSVYFHHLGYAHMHVEKMHKIIETHGNNKKHQDYRGLLQRSAWTWNRL